MEPITFERYLTREEERQLLRTVRQSTDVLSKRDLQIMILMRHTGGRASSILAVTVRDALEALRTKKLHFRKVKSGNTYAVACSTRARAALKALLKVRRDMGHAPELDAPLIMGRKRKGLSVRSLELRLQLWRARSGLAVKVTPHFFRHTLAKRIIETSESKDPLGIVQAALGHRSRNSSAIYARPSREDVAHDMELAG